LIIILSFFISVGLNLKNLIFTESQTNPHRAKADCLLFIFIVYCDFSPLQGQQYKSAINNQKSVALLKSKL